MSTFTPRVYKSINGMLRVAYMNARSDMRLFNRDIFGFIDATSEPIYCNYVRDSDNDEIYWAIPDVKSHTMQ